MSVSFATGIEDGFGHAIRCVVIETYTRPSRKKLRELSNTYVSVIGGDGGVALSLEPCAASCSLSDVASGVLDVINAVSCVRNYDEEIPDIYIVGTNSHYQYRVVSNSSGKKSTPYVLEQFASTFTPYDLAIRCDYYLTHGEQLSGIVIRADKLGSEKEDAYNLTRLEGLAIAKIGYDYTGAVVITFNRFIRDSDDFNIDLLKQDVDRINDTFALEMHITLQIKESDKTSAGEYICTVGVAREFDHLPHTSMIAIPKSAE
jgi:hypothetical protein